MPEGSSMAASSLLRGVRVLIAEDNWAIAMSVQSLVTDVGMMIIGVAATAREAEELGREHVPDVAIVDIKLRDEMAFELIQRLHDLGIRVIVVSGFSGISVASVHSTLILQKPFSREELLLAFRNALEGNISGTTAVLWEGQGD
jgi:DNA-binding NarL/FixJ family response regulator